MVTVARPPKNSGSSVALNTSSLLAFMFYLVFFAFGSQCFHPLCLWQHPIYPPHLANFHWCFMACHLLVTSQEVLCGSLLESLANFHISKNLWAATESYWWVELLKPVYLNVSRKVTSEAHIIWIYISQTLLFGYILFRNGKKHDLPVTGKERSQLQIHLQSISIRVKWKDEGVLLMNYLWLIPKHLNRKKVGILNHSLFNSN